MLALSQAWSSVDQVLMDPRERAGLDVRIYGKALDEVGQRGDQPALHVGTFPATGRGMREALEGALRRLARLTSDRGERVELVDRANDVRPWTLR